MTKPPQEKMLWFNDSNLDSLDDVEEMEKVCKEREVSWARKFMDGNSSRSHPDARLGLDNLLRQEKLKERTMQRRHKIQAGLGEAMTTLSPPLRCQ